MEIEASVRRKLRTTVACLASLALIAGLGGAGPVLADAEDGEPPDIQNAQASGRQEIRPGPVEIIRIIGSVAVLSFAPGAIATLVVTVLLDEDGKEASHEILIDLKLGKISASLGDQFDGRLNVETPGATSNVDATTILVEVKEDGQTLFQVIEGKMAVQAGLRERLVQAGAQTLVLPGRAPLPPSPISRYEPTILLQAPEDLKLQDPPLLDPIDPRIDPPKGGF